MAKEIGPREKAMREQREKAHEAAQAAKKKVSKPAPKKKPVVQGDGPSW